MESYTVFADIYDEFMDNIPYEKWGEYVHSLLMEKGLNSGTIAELGCGTGIMTRILAGYGYEMIGIDISEDMLTRARETEYEQEMESGILYLLQDMRELELAYPVQAIVSLCDSMNYLRDNNELKKVLVRARDNLVDGGIFIFDMKTEHLYKDIMGNSSRSDVRDDAVLIWENEFDDITKDNVYYLTMFIEAYDEEEDNADCETSSLYERYEEEHIQHAFDISEVSALIKEAGLKLLHVYNEGTRMKPDRMSERVYYICGK